MEGDMKRRVFLTVLMGMVLLAGCTRVSNPAGGKHPTTGEAVNPDQLYYDYEDNVDFTIFRAGDAYLMCEDGQNGWSGLEGDVQSQGLNLGDFDFAHVTADMTYLDGGEAGYMNAPMIRKVHNSFSVSFADVLNKGLIEEYDPEEVYFAGPRLYETDDCKYCVVFADYKEYRVYKDGGYIGSYETSYEAEGAIGLHKVDNAADFERLPKLDLYVFRCGDTYLAYCKYYGLSQWTPLLDENYENCPSGFTLDDGEFICLHQADVMKVSGGKAGYVNAPMIMNPGSIEECRYDTPALMGSVIHWEERQKIEEGDLMEYHVSEYLIFYLDGKYHVYAENETKHQELVGVYDTEEEVNAALGIEGD
jgi:hypothetical protein